MIQLVQIDEILGNRKLLQLLLFLIDNPSQEQTYTEIRKKTKLSKATLTKWLGFLEAKRFVFMRPIGTNKLYKINSDNSFLKQFKILFTLLSLASIAKIAQKHDVGAYLFGSMARGEDTEKSDIDLLIIGKIKKEEIILEIQLCTKKLQKEVRLQIFTSLEWSKLAEKDPAFYERVEKDKIRLQ